jgi:SH3-like domain-containing protein
MLLHAALLCLCAIVVAIPASAEEANEAPRFVSIRGEPAYMREGPSTQHKVKWVYHHKGLPVEVLQSYDVWRRVRDADGETGWMHVAVLSGDRTAVVNSEAIAPVRQYADNSAPLVAQAQPGAIGSLTSCAASACEIDFGEVSGWVEKALLWGVYGDERF